MPDIQRTTYIENRLDAYQGFFDGKWKWSFMQVVRDTKLQEIGFDLVRNWEAASNARALPWVMIKCLEVGEHCQIEEAEPLEIRKIRILKNKLLASIEAQGEPLRPMLRKKIQQAVNKIDLEATDALRKTKDQIHESREDLWELLAGVESFHSSLWSSERTCYGSIYYSYEWFLRECVRIKTANTDYRMGRADDFKQDFKQAFGQSLVDSCWNDQQVVIARLTRHALVHNGGRLTDRLGKQPHPFRIEEDEIQVSAKNTTELYNLLQDRVSQLTENATKMPEFT